MLRYDNDAINTYRGHSVTQWASNENECAYFALVAGDRTELRVVTDNTRIVSFSGGIPTVNTVDLNDITNVKEAKINFLSYKTVAVAKNNFAIPVVAEVFLFGCRDDTSSSVLTYWGSDLSDKGLTSYDTDLRFNLQDGAKQMNRYYKFLSHRKYLVNAGEEFSVTLQRKRPFYFDTGNDFTYMKGVTQFAVIRLVGTVAHDSTVSTAVGITPTCLDVYIKTHYRFAAELPSKFKYVIKGTSAPDESTGGFVVSALDNENIQITA